MLILPKFWRSPLRLKSVDSPFQRENFPGRREESLPFFFSSSHSSTRIPLVSVQPASEEKQTWLAMNFTHKIPDLKPSNMSLWISCKDNRQRNAANLENQRFISLLKSKIHSLCQQKFRASCFTEFDNQRKQSNKQHKNMILSCIKRH